MDRLLTILPLESTADAEACARIMVASDPWLTLGRGYDSALTILSNRVRERYVARRDGQLAGFIVLNMNGPFVGYIQIVCTAPEFRGTGVGTQLLQFAEERIFRESPNVFLCVSSFNEGARRLYERLGYTLVGELSDYIVRGYSELLLRKSRGPIDGYDPEARP